MLYDSQIKKDLKILQGENDNTISANDLSQISYIMVPENYIKQLTVVNLMTGYTPLSDTTNTNGSFADQLTELPNSGISNPIYPIILGYPVAAAENSQDFPNVTDIGGDTYGSSIDMSVTMNVLETVDNITLLIVIVNGQFLPVPSTLSQTPAQQAAVSGSDDSDDEDDSTDGKYDYDSNILSDNESDNPTEDPSVVQVIVTDANNNKTYYDVTILGEDVVSVQIPFSVLVGSTNINISTIDGLIDQDIAVTGSQTAGVSDQPDGSLMVSANAGTPDGVIFNSQNQIPLVEENADDTEFDFPDTPTKTSALFTVNTTIQVNKPSLPALDF